MRVSDPGRESVELLEVHQVVDAGEDQPLAADVAMELKRGQNDGGIITSSIVAQEAERNRTGVAAESREK